MANKIYLFGVDKDKSIFVTGMSAVRELAEIHRQEKIDALFLKDSAYSAIERYCKDNILIPIELVETNTHNPLDSFLYVFSYSQRNPQKKRFVQLSNQNELEELLTLFEKAKFLTEKINI